MGCREVNAVSHVDPIRQIFLDFMQMAEFAKDPLVFRKGEGIRLVDINGREYIDGLSGAMVASVGHGDRKIIAAMRRGHSSLEAQAALEVRSPFSRAVLQQT